MKDKKQRKICLYIMEMESDLFDFCMQNTMDLIDGKLSFEKIMKLRDIDFSFDYFIDQLIENEKRIKEGENE